MNKFDTERWIKKHPHLTKVLKFVSNNKYLWVVVVFFIWLFLTDEERDEIREHVAQIEARSKNP